MIVRRGNSVFRRLGESDVEYRRSRDPSDISNANFGGIGGIHIQVYPGRTISRSG